MLPSHDLIFAIIDAIIAWASSIYQFAYFKKHKNGKKNLRMLCSVIMLYFAVMYTLVVFDSTQADFGLNYLRPFMWLLFFVPMWDARIDWDTRE